jgi:hypothetical protein
MIATSERMTNGISVTLWKRKWSSIVCPKKLYSVDPLLGNDSVSTFLWEPTRATVERLLLGNGSVNTPKTIRDNRRRCFPWGPPRGYITGSSKGPVNYQKLREFSWRRVHLSQICQEFGQVLELAVEDDWEEMARTEVDYAKKTSYALQLQWDWYHYYVEIRCQDTTSEDSEP